TANSLTDVFVNNLSDYIAFERGVTTELRVAYCGDTLTHTITPPTQPILTTSVFASTIYSCIDLGGLVFRKNNAVGDSLGVQMLTAPVGQPIIPYLTRVIGSLGNTTNIVFPELQNLLPGPYTFRIWD